MNEESVKISKIKKSCHTGTIVSRILAVICAIFTIIGIVGGIKVLSMGKEFDNMVNYGRFSGLISTSDEIGSASAVTINLGSIPTELHSDIPAVQAAINDHPLSVMYGSYVLFFGLIFILTTAMFFMISSIFTIIEKEATPFTAKVKKRITTVLIVTCVILALTTGSAFAVLCAIITWVINAILDYGITLQTQSDETL
jgi:hypothetical protein